VARSALLSEYLPLIPLLPVLFVVAAFVVLALVSPFLSAGRRRYVLQVLRLFIEMVTAVRKRGSRP
jgi:hypothetical protein